MLDEKERVIITLAFSASAIILIVLAIWRVAFFRPEPQFQKLEPQLKTGNYNQKSTSSVPVVESPSETAALPEADSAASDGSTSSPQAISEQENSPKSESEAEIVVVGPRVSPKANLRDIVRKARTWGPAYSYTFGQKAPDFTLTDINGKLHKLSDYRGKNVLITFWATWCGPCRVEVPHLITLRNTIGEDKLAMLAISYKSIYPLETPEKVKAFVKRNKINYTVFSTDSIAMPLLFSRISGIPCSFFIDPEGKIKLATEGLLSLGEFKAILEAEY